MKHYPVEESWWAAEQAAAADMLGDVHGLYALQFEACSAARNLIDPEGFRASWRVNLRDMSHAPWRGSNTDMPIQTDSIDVVVLRHCLERTELSARLLDEVYRVLRPGGRLLLIDVNAHSWLAWQGSKSEHLCSVSPAWVKQQLLRLGYKVLQHQVLGLGPAKRSLGLRSLPGWLAPVANVHIYLLLKTSAQGNVRRIKFAKPKKIGAQAPASPSAFSRTGS